MGLLLQSFPRRFTGNDNTWTATILIGEDDISRSSIGRGFQFVIKYDEDLPSDFSDLHELRLQLQSERALSVIIARRMEQRYCFNCEG